ncbi:TetR/AcrR family transcriptional regulator [Amycolatopsis nigrescens]|uniref:TetR/AcrR family transcriptional regulator n=1 Tax=Amycolatopsis nigrescens TaxID=381445 RepID=UPI00037C7F37|nr:TetR/AcrR family transcriptional regulator C-terminal domain-containing protein [Amycolatopsis nigrescens]
MSAPGSAEWWTDLAGERPKLSRDLIAEAALRVLDGEGLDALTMRRVAAELDTAAAALYRHVENRDALLVLVVEKVLGEVDPAVPPGGWRERAEWFARGFRAALTRHPAIAPLLVSVPTLGPNALKAFEGGLRVAAEAGFPDELAVASCQAIAFVVRGFAVLQAGDIDPLVVAAGSLGGVAPGALPKVEAFSADAQPTQADELFEFVLASVLDGLAARFLAVTGREPG